MELVEGVPYTLTVDFRVESDDLPLAAVSFGAAFRPSEGALAAAADAARAGRCGAGRRGHRLPLGERG